MWFRYSAYYLVIPGGKNEDTLFALQRKCVAL